MTVTALLVIVWLYSSIVFANSFLFIGSDYVADTDKAIIT